MCWTLEGTAIERICRDQAFFDVVKEKLDEFFVKVILPRFLTGEDTKSNGDVFDDVEKENFCRFMSLSILPRLGQIVANNVYTRGCS